MIYHIKALGQIQQAEKCNFSVVKGGKDAVRNEGQRGFGRVTAPETLLTGREEVVFRKVCVKLLMHSALHDFGYDGNNGYRTEV